ncbi:hypothetical protein Ae717Ps2_6739 [Pseudonocardia sp. Ae717_Ps2]|nr:hypothetical protein Ae717Ps2_6831c [Pseudonocardia sp. Ae717_Ps2]OLM28111.1 hypothetical protein Ae717Ps2_6739 [Pseudonocardia sp. Ae717_Ps2]
MDIRGVAEQGHQATNARIARFPLDAYRCVSRCTICKVLLPGGAHSHERHA